MVVAMALSSALLYSIASVVQQHSAVKEKSSPNRVSLFVLLLGNPLWLFGIVADVFAYVLQFMALGKGSLVFVQPIMVAGLLFALPLGAAFNSKRLRVMEWTGAVAVVVGLSLFLAVSRPQSGSADAPSLTWAAMGAATLVPSALLAVMSRSWRPGPKAVALSAVTGLLYALVAALTKTCASILSHGLAALMESWQTYALVVIGAAALVVGQHAFAAGPLTASLPTLTVVDPLASVALGVGGFGEVVRLGALPATAELVGLALLVAGVILCSRAPVVVGASVGADPFAPGGPPQAGGVDEGGSGLPDGNSR